MLILIEMPFSVILLEALILDLDPVFVVLLVVELASPRAGEQETVLDCDPVQLCEARHLPPTSSA